jgi:hypothetical protein
LPIEWLELTAAGTVAEFSTAFQAMFEARHSLFIPFRYGGKWKPMMS